MQTKIKKVMDMTPEEKEKNKEFKTKLKIPPKLIEYPGEFTDKIGNVLKRGNMVCYHTQYQFQVGVFVGLVERYYSDWGIVFKEEPILTKDYRGKEITYKKTYREKFIKDVVKVTELLVAYFQNDYKGHQKIKFLKLGNNIKLSNAELAIPNLIAIQAPEFRVHKPEIAKCFSLISDLKDGLLKDFEFDEEE